MAWPCRRDLLAALVGALLTPVAVHGAQSSDGRSDDPATAPDSVRAGDGSTLVPLPVVFYQPETGVGFGVAASYYTRLTEPTPGASVPPSLIRFLGVYTAKKQIVTGLAGELFLEGTRYRATTELGYAKFPSKFWGLGNDTPDEAEEDFTPESLNVLTLDVQRELRRGWYAGLSTRAVLRKISEAEPGGLIASGVVPGSQDGWAVGIGLVATRDTRSSTTFPTSGTFHQLRATIHGTAVGDFGYGAYTLDLRRYLGLGGFKVLALRAVGMATSGTAPFDALPRLGGDSLLRGFYQGRFTDRQLLGAQAEYRAPAFWRLAWVAFGGVGQVSDDWSGFALDGFKAAVGGGLRFMISERERLFIRADLGYGIDTASTGFYLQIGEAF